MSWYNLGPFRPFNWGGRPPQILEQDLPVFKEYKRLNKDIYKGFYFNVCLSFQNLPQVEELKISKSWLMSTSLRIDALGITYDGKAHILEITRHAGLRSMGQAIGYKFMYEQIKPLNLPVESFVVCTSHGYDIPIILKHFGCHIIKIKAPISNF